MKKVFRKLAIKVIGKEITDRFGAESPDIFKKIQYAGLILVAVSGGIASSTVALPALLVAHAANIGFVGGTMVTIGKLAVKDDTVLDK